MQAKGICAGANEELSFVTGTEVNLNTFLVSAVQLSPDRCKSYISFPLVNSTVVTDKIY